MTRSWSAYLFLVSCTATVPPAKPTEPSSRPVQPAASAQPEPASADPPLPGSVIALDDAVSSSAVVVIAKITTLGLASPGPPAEADYDGAEAVVVEHLHGQPLDGTITIDFRVKTSPAAPATESAPREGDVYILFLAPPRSGSREVIKILPPSKGNVSAVREHDAGRGSVGP